MKDLSLQLDDSSDGYPIVLNELSSGAMQEVLFFHCARLYPLSPAYMRQQLGALNHNRHHELHHLARACQYFARQRSKGRAEYEILRRLASHSSLATAAEFIARALTNLQTLEHVREQPRHRRSTDVSLPYPLFAEPRPMQPGLLRALLQWPNNDALLPRILASLARQPMLSLTLRRYATRYTTQGKLLDLKPALLLLGPKRSRELVLLAQFETHLLQPAFPLKPDLIQRQRLIQHMLALLTETFKAKLPIRPELLAYLLIYDAWRAPDWLVASGWNSAANVPINRIERWLQTQRPHHHRVAKRLCDFWRLPKQVGSLLSQTCEDTRLNSIVGLSVAAVEVVQHGIHKVNAHNYSAFYDLDQLISSFNGQSVEYEGVYAYLELCWRAAAAANFRCTLPDLMRP